MKRCICLWGRTELKCFLVNFRRYYFKHYLNIFSYFLAKSWVHCQIFNVEKTTLEERSGLCVYVCVRNSKKVFKLTNSLLILIILESFRPWDTAGEKHFSHFHRYLQELSNAKVEGVNFLPSRRRVDVSTLIIDGELHRKGQFMWCCPTLTPAAAISAGVASSSLFFCDCCRDVVSVRRKGEQIYCER